MIELRRATLDDVPALHALVERAYRGDSAKSGWTHEADLLDGQRTDPDALRATLADPAHRIIMAHDGPTHDGAALVGCVQISRNDPGRPGRAYLGLLTVHPERQAGGIGRQLLAAAERAVTSDFGAAKFCPTIMEMTVIAQRSELIAYYVRRGYQLTGEQRPFPYGNDRFGLPRTGDLYFVVLEKQLKETTTA